MNLHSLFIHRFDHFHQASCDVAIVKFMEFLARQNGLNHAHATNFPILVMGILWVHFKCPISRDLRKLSWIPGEIYKVHETAILIRYSRRKLSELFPRHFKEV